MNVIEMVMSGESAVEYLKGKQESIPHAIGASIDEVNQRFADRVRANLSGGVLDVVSGRLRDTVQQIPAQVLGPEVYGAVEAGGPEAPYGIFFEEGGTKEYIIRPVHARVLAFMIEGAQIFAMIVHHPPTPKLPWFAPEVPNAQEAMYEKISEAFNEVFGES